jgi:hypothetical protein
MPIMILTIRLTDWHSSKQSLIKLTELELLIFIIIVIMMPTFFKKPNKNKDRNKTL